MKGALVANMNECEFLMSHYDDVLSEARKQGELTANKYIFELYTILKDEENLPPEDCRYKIEHDCMYLWSKATIMKFLPEEAKNPKKSRAGKLGAEQKRKLEEEENLKESEVIEQTTDGNSVVISNRSTGARTNLAGNSPISQKEEESRRFHAELEQELNGRGLSPDLIEASNALSDKDKEIEELRNLLQEEYSRGTKQKAENGSELLCLPYEMAQEIYDIVHSNNSLNESSLPPRTKLVLEHDGHQVIAVQSMSNADGCSTESDRQNANEWS